MLDRRPDVPDYHLTERNLNHVPHDLLLFDLYRRRAAVRHDRIRGRPTTTEAGRLDGKGLPLPYRRGPARTEAALCDDRCAHGRAGAGAARFERLEPDDARPDIRWRIVRAGPAAGRRQILPHRPRRGGRGRIIEALERAAHGL